MGFKWAVDGLWMLDSAISRDKTALKQQQVRSKEGDIIGRKTNLYRI